MVWKQGLPYTATSATCTYKSEKCSLHQMKDIGLVLFSPGKEVLGLFQRLSRDEIPTVLAVFAASKLAGNGAEASPGDHLSASAVPGAKAWHGSRVLNEYQHQHHVVNSVQVELKRVLHMTKSCTAWKEMMQIMIGRSRNASRKPSLCRGTDAVSPGRPCACQAWGCGPLPLEEEKCNKLF
jgi:hypothetical protein